jgi:peptidoglycan pentaglycine glycine transferase (the first glycine)
MLVPYNIFMQLFPVTDALSWNEFVNESNFGHPLQLWGWGEAKRLNGWTPYRLTNADRTRGAQVLLWKIPRTSKYIAYIPRGPICTPDERVDMLDALAAWAKTRKVLYLRVEPAWRSAVFPARWKKSRNSIQLPATYTIDLRKSEDDLLGSMERKHRQYINKSARDGVVIKRFVDGDIESMWAIYQQTAHRAGFGLHAKTYYEELLKELGESSQLYYAYVDNKPEAFLWLACASQTAYELYGGVTQDGQNARANYILKWTAIREMKAANHKIYDFNGRLNDGVGKFKDGFGPEHTDWVGTFDYPVQALGYLLWESFWPFIRPVGRKLMRSIKR